MDFCLLPKPMSYSNEKLLSEIHRLNDELGHAPSLAEFREHGEYSATTYYSRFGSGTEAIEAAGYKPNEPDTKVSNEDLIEELQRLAEEVGKKPTAAQMNEKGRYWRSTYKNEFGSWNDALEAGGFEPETIGANITDEELIQELKRVTDKLGEPPTFRDMQDEGNYSPHTYERHFGSWNQALRVAGFEPDNRGSRISEDGLLDEITRLTDEFGESPSVRLMDEKGKYGSATYQRRFGSWSKAVEAALE
jgi:hypothetical protein